MDKITEQCPQTTTFLKRKESRSGIEPRSFRLPASITPYRWAKPAHRCTCTETTILYEDDLGKANREGICVTTSFDPVRLSVYSFTAVLWSSEQVVYWNNGIVSGVNLYFQHQVRQLIQSFLYHFGG